jgi:hypothetical protein
MDISIMTTVLLILFFIGLLVLEWRYRQRLLRAMAIAISLIVMLFAQPGFHRAARVAFWRPEAERILRIGNRRVTDYESGIMTMEQALVEDASIGADARHISLAVLIWLALTPILRDRHIPSRSKAHEDVV